jgi:hypothetical protein
MKNMKAPVDFFDCEIQQSYEPRWIKSEHVHEIINYWHLSKVALSGTTYGRYERLIWAATEFSKKYSYLTISAAYKDLNCMTEGY